VATVNRQITLAARPVGLPKVSDFHLVFAPVPIPKEGEVLARSIYLSLDPSLRERMNEIAGHEEPVAIGGVMAGGAVAQVMASRDPKFLPGDFVQGMLGWQEFSVAPGGALRKINPGVAPLSTALGVLGNPGLTAYFGLLDICAPQPGETVVVSWADGAVGMLVGQIAKIRGCRVVGVAESNTEASWLLDELGFDAALNHKATANGCGKLKRLCPDGVDVYFDNVGGVITDAVVQLINGHARISVCGQTSQDNLEQPEHGPRWLGRLVGKEAKVQGFLVSGCSKRFPGALKQLAAWLRQGKLKYREEVAQGIESSPQAFIGMLQGKNHGKLLVRLSEF